MNEQKKNKLAITSFLLGIISIIANLRTHIFKPDLNNYSLLHILSLLFIISILFVILSIVLGVVSLKQIKETKEKGKLFAILGISAGLVSIVYNLLLTISILGIFLIIITGITLTNTLLIMKFLKTRMFKDKIYVLISGVLTLAIILFIYFVFFIYLNPSPSPPDSCVSTAGISCKSYEVDISNNRLNLAFVNDLGYSITLSNVNISYKGKTISKCDTPGQIMHDNGTLISSENPVQPESRFMFRNCTLTTENTTLSEKKPGDKVKIDFSFNYISTDENKSLRNTYGTLTAIAR